MKLTMLGTGFATATKCYNTCFALSNEQGHFLVDGGGGNQILSILEEENISLQDIHHVFVTHGHTDHLFGVLWIIRMIGAKMVHGFYEGNLYVYCHKELHEMIETICTLTIWGNATAQFGKRIHFVELEDGDVHEVLRCRVEFFDIHSTKKKQFGFALRTSTGGTLVCCGDEPIKEQTKEYARGCDWMLHEAFCLYAEREQFRPYEKHHSTVKDACEMAEALGVKNLVLYHTEDKNLTERKVRYTQEGKQYYHGNLFVPDDREKIELY